MRFTQARLDDILSVAKSRQLDIETAKCTSGLLAITGLLGASNPFLLCSAVMGTALYAATVLIDYGKCGRWYITPLWRKDLIDEVPDTLAGNGPVNLDHPLLAYCNMRETTEYKLLLTFDTQIEQQLQLYPVEDYKLIYQRLMTKLLEGAEFESLGFRLPVVQPPKPAQPEYAEPKTENAPKPTAPAAAKPISDPVQYLLGKEMESTLITAASGAGKDILLSNAISRLDPKWGVIVLDCKDDPREYSYYDRARLNHLAHFEVRRINALSKNASVVAEWCDAALDEFLNAHENWLLIVNEGTLLREKSQRYVDVANGLVLSGGSRELIIWEAGQSAHTSALRTDGSNRSLFRPMLMGYEEKLFQVEAILQAKYVSAQAKDMSEIRSCMRQSPIRRAWCDGMRWYPMPQLQNYSGYDRDAAKRSNNHDSSIA